MDEPSSGIGCLLVGDQTGEIDQHTAGLRQEHRGGIDPSEGEPERRTSPFKALFGPGKRREGDQPDTLPRESFTRTNRLFPA